MRSVKTKIGALVLVSVMLVSLTIGLLSIHSSKEVVKKDSIQYMMLQSENKAEVMNAQLSRIEQSVETVANYALNRITDVKRFQNDNEYVKNYCAEIEDMAINAAHNTEGAMSVYIRFNPEFTEPTSGLFASRESMDEGFEKLTPTDFSIYDTNDVAHVGWYYIPVNNGKPTWMSPYLNENLNVTMISYVIPLTLNGVSIGVVGMDINFDVMKKIIDETKIYNTGYALLIDEQENIVYSPLTSNNESGSKIEKEKSNQYEMADIKNGMNLVLTAPLKEINAEASELTIEILFISLLGCFIVLIFSLFVIRSIVKPIHELNKVAGEIANGELDVTVSCSSKDEIGDLSESFRKMVVRLRLYITYINEASAALRQLAEGNLIVTLKQEYAGEFAPIKNAIITISENLNNDLYQIKSASASIAVSAEQVSSGAQLLSEGASQQADAVEHLSLITRALSEKAEENSEGARKVCGVAGGAGSDLQENGRKMGEIVEAMKIISTNGEEIIKVTKTIEDIAMQTNILALNASIEAARAGEAGKGFSIVAQEVEKLAQESSQAATAISKLINSAVVSIEEGTKIVNETEKSVLETATNAKEVVKIMEQIVKDSEEQNNIVHKVLENIETISEVVQQATAASQEESAASEDLSGQARIMKELVDKFQLKNN